MQASVAEESLRKKFRPRMWLSRSLTELAREQSGQRATVLISPDLRHFAAFTWTVLDSASGPRAFIVLHKALELADRREIVTKEAHEIAQAGGIRFNLIDRE